MSVRDETKGSSYSVLDLRYLKLDQTTPQTTTGTFTFPTVNFGATTGVSATATNGILTLAGLKSGGFNENLTIDFEATANQIDFGSGTGVTTFNFNKSIQITGTTGTALSDVPLTFIRNVATDGGLGSAMRNIMKCAGNMGDGFGPKWRFEIQDNTAGPNNIAELAVFRSGNDTSGSMQFRTANTSSTPAARWTINSIGSLLSGTDGTAANALTTAGTITGGQIIDSGLTASKVVFTDGSKQLTSTGIGLSTQFIKGDGSLDSSTYQPLDATLTSLAAVAGVQGDILYASGTDAWTSLAKSTTASSFLKNSGTNNNPAWSTIAQADVGGLTTASSPTFVGLTLSGLTLGSVLFAGTGGALTQDNAKFFWDNTNKRLGIGTASPATYLDIFGSNAAGLRLRGATSATEIADIYVSGYGVLELDNTHTGADYAYISVKPKQAGYYGFLLWDCTGGASAWANFFVNDTTLNYLNINVNDVNPTAGFIIQEGGNVGIGILPASAKFQVLKTTEQMRIGYDANNYWKTTVASNGSTTFDLVGTSPTFTFSDPVYFTSPIYPYILGWGSIQPAFGQPYYAINELCDILWKADLRFAITSSNAYSYANVFDGSYDSYLEIPVSTTETVQIDFSGYSGVPAAGISYPDGAVYVSFSFTSNNYSAIAAYIYVNDAEVQLAAPVDISTNPSYKVLKFTIPDGTHTYIDYLKITITTNGSDVVRIAAINYTLTRFTTETESPFLSKYNVTNRLFGDFKIVSDSYKIFFGAGSDMSIDYDGTIGNIKTDLVSASDLHVDCGTAKTLVLDIPVYNDANVGSLVLVTGGTLPGVVEILDNAGNATGIYTRGFAINEQGSGSIEIPHDYAEGTNMVFHVHWMGQDAPAGGSDNVKWQVTYTITRDEVTTPAVTTDSAETAFDTQYEWKRTDVETIVGTNLKIGDQVNFTIKRIAASSDDYGGEALVGTLGFHYQCDTLGSRSIGTK